MSLKNRISKLEEVAAANQKPQGVPLQYGASIFYFVPSKTYPTIEAYNQVQSARRAQAEETMRLYE